VSSGIRWKRFSRTDSNISWSAVSKSALRSNRTSRDILPVSTDQTRVIFREHSIVISYVTEQKTPWHLCEIWQEWDRSPLTAKFCKDRSTFAQTLSANDQCYTFSVVFPSNRVDSLSQSRVPGALVTLIIIIYCSALHKCNGFGYGILFLVRSKGILEFWMTSV